MWKGEKRIVQLLNTYRGFTESEENDDFLDLIVSEGDIGDIASDLKYMRQAVGDRHTVRGKVLVGTTNSLCVDMSGTDIPGMCSANAAATFLVYLGVLSEEYAINPQRMYIDFTSDFDQMNMPINESFAGVIAWGLTRLYPHIGVIVDYFDADTFELHEKGHDVTDAKSYRRYLLRDNENLNSVEDVEDLAGSEHMIVLTNWVDSTRPHPDLLDDLRSEHILPDRSSAEWMGSVVVTESSDGVLPKHVSVMVPYESGIELMDSNIDQPIYDFAAYREYKKVTDIINVFRLF